MVPALVLLAALIAGCHAGSSPRAAASRRAHPTATTPTAPSPAAVCPTPTACYRQGTVTVTVTGAITTTFSATLDSRRTIVNLPGAITLAYAQPNGVGAIVGEVNRPGQAAEGGARVNLLPPGSGYFGTCDVSVGPAPGGRQPGGLPLRHALPAPQQRVDRDGQRVGHLHRRTLSPERAPRLRARRPARAEGEPGGSATAGASG
jgi:hypothetical protein